jgi:DNA-binding response OmpR family regulator
MNVGRWEILHQKGERMTENSEHKEKILVVDDEAQNVELIKEFLEADDYEVSTAYNGEDALKKAQKELPDLVLLDIMMPKMDGYQVCEALRNADLTKDIPIIFVTAKTEVKDWTHAIFNMGANSYITKPINSKKLLEKVQGVLKMKHSRDELRKTREKLSKAITDK